MSSVLTAVSWGLSRRAGAMPTWPARYVSGGELGRGLKSGSTVSGRVPVSRGTELRAGRVPVSRGTELLPRLLRSRTHCLPPPAFVPRETLRPTQSPLASPRVRPKSSPVRPKSSSVRSTSSSVRSTSSPVRSTSSPMRSMSSPMRSMSSPVRSMSSPVRSMSSSMRSMSSPVRSMSSPMNSGLAPRRWQTRTGAVRPG